MTTPEWRQRAESVADAFRDKLTAGTAGWLRARCPFCEDRDGKPDHKESLGLNTATGGFNCFKCQSSGRLPKDIRDDLGLEDLGDLISPELRVQAPAPVIEPAHGYVPLYESPYDQAASLSWAREYLEVRRHLAPTALREMAVGAASSGPLAGRVIFPILHPADPSAPWLGWFARDALGTNSLKHRYPRGMSRSNLMYNAAALAAASSEPIFVCEGVLDAAPLWPDGVACMGKPLESHIELLQGTERPIVCCLDGDAWEESWMLSLKLRFLGKRAGYVRFPPKTDPNDADPTWIREEAARCLV